MLHKVLGASTEHLSLLQLCLQTFVSLCHPKLLLSLLANQFPAMFLQLVVFPKEKRCEAPLRMRAGCCARCQTRWSHSRTGRRGCWRTGITACCWPAWCCCWSCASWTPTSFPPTGNRRAVQTGFVSQLTWSGEFLPSHVPCEALCCSAWIHASAIQARLPACYSCARVSTSAESVQMHLQTILGAGIKLTFTGFVRG